MSQKLSVDGTGILCGWFEVDDDVRDNFLEWHNREHLAERIEVPGFIRGRRFVASSGPKQYFIIYDLADITVLASPAYAERTDNPTPWTQAFANQFRNSFRSALRVVYSKGEVLGGCILTLRLSTDGSDRLENYLAGTLLPAMADQVGITRVRFAIADADISNIGGAKRHNAYQLIDRIILVEAMDESRLAPLLDGDLSAESLARHGAAGPFEPGIFRLQVCHPARALG